MKILSSLLEMHLLCLEKEKNRLEHEYAVKTWALSLQPNIQADCMECLSIENGDISKTVNEVVSQLHYPLCPNKKVTNKSIDEIIDIFWKKISNLQLSIKLLQK